MRKLLATIFAVSTVLMLSLQSVMAAPFVEGKNYEVLDQPLSSKPVVTEFFAFTCPHCFSFEPVAKQIKATLPDGATFQQYHVPFLGGRMGKEYQKAFAVAKLLGVEESMTPVIFSRIHEQKKPFSSAKDLRSAFIAQGVKAEEYDSAANSFAAAGLVAKMDKATQSGQVNGTPTVIVNNKYKVKTEGIRSLKEYLELVQYLLTLS